jgi:DNA-binding transcriptional ArsR family regulator
MVESNASRLNDLFRALADPTRRAMLQDLARGPRSVGQLAAPYAISLAAASKHIQTLEHAGLVAREVQGRVHTCRLQAAPLHLGAEWLRHYQRFWTGKLDVLEAILEAEDARTPKPSASAPAPRRPRSPRRKP